MKRGVDEVPESGHVVALVTRLLHQCCDIGKCDIENVILNL